MQMKSMKPIQPINNLVNTDQEPAKLRLLILGGSYLQIPAIIEAKAMGIEVAVLDYNANCPGRDLADRFYLESTYDLEAVLKCAREFDSDGIITLGTDWPMRSVAYASEALGLHSISYQTACRSTNKRDMIIALEAAGVNHPNFLYFDPSTQDISTFLNKISLPCVVKPTDSSGSRGVVLVRAVDALQSTIQYSGSFSSSGDVLIEQFMEGPEVSVEVIIQRGQPRVLAITDKTTSGSPQFVEIMHTQPSRLSDQDQRAIANLAVNACLALELDGGAAHVEIILTKNGPKIVEVGPRMGGDYIATHLVPLSTGINMTRLVIQEALNINFDIPAVVPGAACICYLETKNGILKEVTGLDAIKQDPEVVSAGIFIKPGTQVKELQSSMDRLGYIITKGTTAEEAYQANLVAQSKLSIVMEN